MQTKKIFETLSWGIVIVLFVSAILIVMFPPVPEGFVAGLIGVTGATIFYFILYTVEAVILAYSKLRQRKLLRKNILMVIYLSGFFITILSIVILGWTPKFIDNLIVAGAAAVCWLYWTFTIDYINPNDIVSQIEPLRDDLPPEA